MSTSETINQTPDAALRLREVLGVISQPLAEKWRYAAVVRGGQIQLLDTKKGNRTAGYVRIGLLGDVEVEQAFAGRQSLMGSLVVRFILDLVSAAKQADNV